MNSCKVADLERNPNAKIRLKGRRDSSVDRDADVSHLWRFSISLHGGVPTLRAIDDTFNAWHTPGGEDGGRREAQQNQLTNPCGEYASR